MDDEPYGITVTRTLHLHKWVVGEPQPLCGSARVRRLIRENRADGAHRAPVIGCAEGRPVCRHCIRRAMIQVALLIDQLTLAQEHNDTHHR